jgi:hypothetical protein
VYPRSWPFILLLLVAAISGFAILSIRVAFSPITGVVVGGLSSPDGIVFGRHVDRIRGVSHQKEQTRRLESTCMRATPPAARRDNYVVRETSDTSVPPTLIRASIVQMPSEH